MERSEETELARQLIPGDASRGCVWIFRIAGNVCLMKRRKSSLRAGARAIALRIPSSEARRRWPSEIGDRGLVEASGRRSLESRDEERARTGHWRSAETISVDHFASRLGGVVDESLRATAKSVAFVKLNEHVYDNGGLPGSRTSLRRVPSHREPSGRPSACQRSSAELPEAMAHDAREKLMCGYQAVLAANSTRAWN